MIKIRRFWRVGAAAVLTLSTVAASEAQNRPRALEEPPGDTLFLTLAQAQLHALENNPALLATRRLREAAEGRLRQARVYRFNPEVTLESEQVGSGRTLRAYEGEVSQEVEWAGQWGLRKRVAEHGLASTDGTVRDAERLTRAAVAAVFYETLGAQNRVALAEEIRTLNERLAVAVSDLLEAGSISLLEANLARIESGRAQTRVLEERRDAKTALLELRQALALPDAQPLRLSPDVPIPPEPSGLNLDSLVRVAIVRRPDLGSAASRIEAGQSLVSLARRGRIPNLRLTVPFDRLEGPGSEQIGIGVGVSIPLWNRNQGTIAELQADLARARSERDAVESTVRTEVVDAYQRYVSAKEEEQIAAVSVLQPARFNQGLLDEAFRSGKIDLATLLLVRNALLDAELDYWESWLELRLELVRLAAVTAEPLPNQ
ncbi:MAG: TolC family protein [Gemmatimonadota bacterium]|nr:MAG: TolC family protein [Gemmatimonadota bacterium]